MTLRKIALQIHLWLGLTSGAIVFVICSTGAIWVFNDEITSLINNDNIPIQPGKQILKPSEITLVCNSLIPGKEIKDITYTRNKPVRVWSWGKDHSIALFVDPYTGKQIRSIDYRSNNGSFNFFNFILQGHRFLWLPWKIGRPIVNYATLVFVLTLITGLFLWWPITLKAFKTAISFRWKKGVGTRRKIYDLHKILGFYVTIVLLAIALTGMTWGLEWYSKGMYKLTSGGKDLFGWQISSSDTLQANKITKWGAVDQTWDLLCQKYPTANAISIRIPDDSPTSTITATVFPTRGKTYNKDVYVYDRYTLKEIKTTGPDYGKYNEATGADKLRRMNYDIHTGSIWGLPGKIMVFFAAIIGASLPVTGVYLWLKKRGKKQQLRVGQK